MHGQLWVICILAVTTEICYGCKGPLEEIFLGRAFRPVRQNTGRSRSLFGHKLPSDIIEPGKVTIGDDGVLRGPRFSPKVPNSLLGRWIFDSLQKATPNLVMMIQFETGQEVSAKDILNQGSKLAVALNKQYGVGRRDTVAIVGVNTIDINIAGIATLFLGAVFSPIDPSSDSTKFQHAFKVTSPKLIIADSAIISNVTDSLRKINKKVTVISAQTVEGYVSVGDLIAQVQQTKPFRPADGNRNDVATVVFTSGSSALPKGVALTHYALAYQVLLFSKPPNPMRQLETSYFHWISGILLMIRSLTNAIPRVLVKSSNSLDILSAIDKYRPDACMTLPYLMDVLLKHPRVNDFNLTSVERITFGGGPLNKNIYDEVTEKWPNCTLIQTYGLTEVSGIVSYATPPVDVLSAGKVVPGFQVKIIDNTTKSVGANITGEVLCKGPSLLRGYINEKNEMQRAVDSDGWFHTGDIGRYTPDGVLYIVSNVRGAITVNSNGHQVFPNELENVISQLDGVEDVAVAGVHSGDNELVMALVVRREGYEVTAQQVENIVKDNLPDYDQITGGVKFVDTIPRTSTGKINRKAVDDLAQKLYAEQ